MPSRRRKSVSAGVIDEHAAILRSVEALERALAYLTSRRLRTWRQRLLRDLMPVSASFREHCASTERRGGTLAEFGIVIGRRYQLTAALKEHEQLMALASGLIAAIEHAGDAAFLPVDARDSGAQLTTAIRGHCRSEVDLIQLRFNLDIGVID